MWHQSAPRLRETFAISSTAPVTAPQDSIPRCWNSSSRQCLFPIPTGAAGELVSKPPSARDFSAAFVPMNRGRCHVRSRKGLPRDVSITNFGRRDERLRRPPEIPGSTRISLIHSALHAWAQRTRLEKFGWAHGLGANVRRRSGLERFSPNPISLRTDASTVALAQLVYTQRSPFSRY